MLARGVLVPLLSRLDWMIVDGERRWLAAQLKGIEELPVIVTDKPEGEIRGIQLATVFHKADLNFFEKWRSCEGLMRANPQWQMNNLAKFLHIDPSHATRMLSPSKCIGAWQDALKAGTVGLSHCYAASKLPESEQAALLALKLSGASRDQIERQGRKQRNGYKTSVRVSRVKIAMPGKINVVISGKEMSMAELVDLLSDVTKEARKVSAIYDVKTWMRMMADRARA
jgi:ParB/RepB/Spo0J family partition protein